MNADRTLLSCGLRVCSIDHFVCMYNHLHSPVFLFLSPWPLLWSGEVGGRGERAEGGSAGTVLYLPGFPLSSPDLAGVGELEGGKTPGLTVDGRGVDVVEGSTNGII